MRIWLNRTLWGLMLLLSLIIGLYAMAFFFVDGLGGPEFKSKFATVPLPAWSHIIGGGICLILGSLQFHTGLRAKFPHIHRWSGKTYLVCVLFGGIGGLILAPGSEGGAVAHIGFGTLAVIWLYSGGNAYRFIRAGNIQQHRLWMIRNFSLTLAAVTLRIHLPILQGVFGLTFDDAYQVVAWLAWVPNLIIAEWLIIAPVRKDTPHHAP